MPTAYRLSLTAASLHEEDMGQLAETYLQLGDWPATRTSVLERRLLKTTKSSSAKRIYRELELRLRHLDPNLLMTLAHGGVLERKLLSFVACCRTYPFLRRFVLDVLTTKTKTHQLEVTPGDYHRYFDQEALAEPRLEEISDSTARKLQSRTMALLREAGLLERDRLSVPYLSMAMRHTLGEDVALVFGQTQVPLHSG